MNQGGFLDTSRPRPIGLGVVIAGHVAVLAAVMLAKGEMTRPPPTPFIVQSYPDDIKPPPELPKPIPPRTQARTQRTITDPRPLPQPGPIEPEIVVPTFPANNDGPLFAGTGGDTAAGPVVRPLPPVTVEARIDPRFAADFQPAYPPSAQRGGIEGRATVRVRIGADGRVRAVELVRADDPAFFEATQKQAMRRWRFIPTTRDGSAIDSWKTLTVNFILRE